MKVARYYSRHDVRIEDMRRPAIRDGEILVKMRACGICGSDLMDWYLERRAPLVLGHEPTGIVAEKGDKVEGFEVSDRVFVHHHAACLKCYYCRHGDYTLCEQFHETNIEPGGFAEYFRVPASNLELDTLKLSDNVSFEEGTLIEPVGCCLRALEKCSIQKSDSVAIVGAGVTGIIHVALSKILGADEVFVSDLFEFRLDAAKEFGADFVVNPRTEDLSAIVHEETAGRGADIVVVTAPSLEAYKTGLGICRKGGKLCVFAPTVPEDFLKVRPKELFFSEVKMIPSYSTSHREIKEALELIEFGRLDVSRLITHRFKLANAAEAFKAASQSKESLKVVVLNGDE